MSIEFNVDIDREQLKEAISLFEFVGGNVDDALRVAINKAGPKIKTLAGREIREQVSLKAAYVNDRLTFSRATRKDLSGAIGTPSRGLLLSRFSTEPNVANESIAWIKAPPNPYGGHYIKIKPGAAQKKIGSAGDSKPFYIVLRGSRALGIARREADGKLDVLHGPSLSQVFDSVRDDVLPDAAAELQVQVLDAMRYLLVKRYPPEPVV